MDENPVENDREDNPIGDTPQRTLRPSDRFQNTANDGRVFMVPML